MERERHQSSATPTTTTIQQASFQKQSFLSKFSRSEVKSAKSVDRSSQQLIRSSDVSNSDCQQQQQTTKSDNSNNNQNNHQIKMEPTHKLMTSSELDQSDKTNLTKPKTGQSESASPRARVESFCELESGGSNKTPGGVKNVETIGKGPQQTNDNVAESRSNNNNKAEDDNDQVLPVWPSKIDATTLEPSMFQVYSLKDYSQVAGPTENVTSSTAGGRLLKSMSQDRKVDSRSKRMSECVLSNVSTTTSGEKSNDSTGRQHRLPSMIGKISTTATMTNLRTMGPATSVNSLLPPSKNSSALISESRIDRMRKLFVSPLSLRGSASAKSSSAQATQAHHQASSHSRLSLQAGANMLNKPHHLMHAMYRTRVGGAQAAHYSRRSPMRQKPGTVRGFRVYGCPLSMANTMYPITCFGRAEIYKQQSVPYILARLCYYIEENSSKLTHEGIFRVSGNARLMEKLKTLFDHLGDAPLELESVDVATSASMLKMYLRELPDPLIPTRMNYYFLSLAKKYSTFLSKISFDNFRQSENISAATTTPKTNNNNNNEPSSISADGQSTLDRQKMAFIRDLTKLIRKLPIENYNLLKYLACFLHRISLKQQSNKMSAEALGIVFGPNIFRIRSESFKGLKEQELSNQIMASIISNYKQIFDCELTDALGNLIKSDEHSGRERDELLESGARQLIAEQPSGGDIDGEATSSSSKLDNANSQPLPTTSSSFASNQKSVCSKARAGRPIAYRYDGRESDDEQDLNIQGDEEDDDGEDGDFDDDEECDDGSYSQTSDSGSYCSSMASDSVESIYEGDIEAGEHYDDDDDDRDFPLGSQSTSECGSETSYTPSSSHSETNANEVELSSSDFSSNHSLADAGGGAAADGDDNESNMAQQPTAQRPCLVCKRRESQQLEASRMREQIRLAATQNDGDGKDSNQAIGEAEEQIGGKVGAKQNQSAAAKSSGRLSTRRRRANEDSKRAISTVATTATRIDITDPDNNRDRLVPSQPSQSSRPNRHSNHHQQRLENKRDPMRRRSSSASSLLRISNRLEHSLAASSSSRKRSVGKEDPGHRNKSHLERRRCNEPHGYNRKSRNKMARKDGSRPSGQQSSSNRAAACSSKGAPHSVEWRKGDCFVPELQLAMNLQPETKEDLVWNYVSSSFLDVPDGDRFYQLRSYNSDETLLRSKECETRTSAEVTTRARRRFSGQDYLNYNQENLLANVHSEFQKIAETFEDESLNDQVLELGHGENQSRRLELLNAEVQSSVVSLLGEQMVSFKHSTLSLDEAATPDPIVNQLKVIKDLVKTLEKLIKVANLTGFDQEISQYLLQQVGGDLECESCLDNISSCCFDHLAAKNIILILDSLERYNADWPKIDLDTQNRLIDLLTIKIAELKKRYSNLKYIREHYHKHHMKQKMANSSSLSTTTTANDVMESREGEESSSLQPDGQSAWSDVSSLNSVANSMLLDSDPKASQPRRQSNDSSRLVGSCKFGSLCPVEFVFNMEKQLASRRQSGSRLVKLTDMTPAQLQSEKLELQKNLLRYEHWFGRPTTRSEFNLIGHLYERYRAIKIIKQQKLLSG